MSDARKDLLARFETRHRYANFGEVLTEMRINGFRCHNNTFIHIESPITAFCGLNGTGKSTLLQLAAIAYKNPSPMDEKYYLRDFFVVSKFDYPFTDDAAVEYKYWQEDRSQKLVRIYRSAEKSNWQGYYKPRPARHIFFAGIGLYLPKIEQHDFICREARTLEVIASRPVPDRIRDWTSRILGQNYENIISNEVTSNKQIGTVVSVRREGTTYSEPNMGFGEGRTQYLVSQLESIPNRSLILIEEPETSLHPKAQKEFGRYLVDVTARKCHQILISSHSEFILEALPSKSIIYLFRKNNKITTNQRLTALQTKSLMTLGEVKSLHVLVEDEIGKLILSEMIRRVAEDFLRSIGIYPIGSAEKIERIMEILYKADGTPSDFCRAVPIAAVMDGDQEEHPDKNLFVLPGDLAPEKEIFGNSLIKDYLSERYGVNMNDFLASVRGSNHHDWPKLLAVRVNQNFMAIMGELAHVYAKSLPENDAYYLCKKLGYDVI